MKPISSLEGIQQNVDQEIHQSFEVKQDGVRIPPQNIRRLEELDQSGCNWDVPYLTGMDRGYWPIVGAAIERVKQTVNLK